MYRQLTKNAHLVALVIGVDLLIISFVWMKTDYHTAADRAETINAAVQRNANLVVALEQYAVRTITNADAVLKIVKDEYEHEGNRIEFKALLDSFAVDREFFLGVSICNEKGDLVVTNLPGLSDSLVNISQTETYQNCRSATTQGLHIGKPMFCPLARRHVIPVSRSLYGANGRFKGIATVQIEPSTFTRFYADAALQPHDIISLISLDGLTLSRRTGAVDSHSENISKSPLFDYAKKKPVGSYFARDAIHHIPTHFSYRKLPHYDLLATVGTAESDVLTAFYERAERDYFSATMISALVLIFSLVAGLSLHHRRKHLDQLKESEERYRSIFENSSDGLLLLKADGRILAANKAAETFFCGAEQLQETMTAELAVRTDPAFEWLLKEAVLMGQASSELQFLRSDGVRVKGEAASARYRDAEGKIRCVIIIRDSTERMHLQKKLAVEQRLYQRRLTEQVIKAQEREREIIGRELHDNVNQVLTTVKLYLEMAIEQTNLRETLLPKSIRYVTESIHEIRTLSHHLSAPTLGTKSLVDSLTALVETVEGSSGLRIAFTHTMYRQHICMDKKLALYRIAQEQLNNIVRHAQATTVTISLAQSQQHTVLCISDNGRGFDPVVCKKGIGLNNIIGRAKVFDGHVHIDAAPGEGCCLTVSLPLPTSTETAPVVQNKRERV